MTSDSPAPTSRQLGQQAERRALHYLQRQGLQLVQANYYCRGGEIDLIMQQPARQGTASSRLTNMLRGNVKQAAPNVQEVTLVFVEVRARQSAAYGSAAMSVTPDKQRRVLHAAQHFLASHPQWQSFSIRCDVIAIDGDQLEWLPNAFGLE